MTPLPCVILWHFCHPTPIKSYVLFECPLRRIFFDEFLFLYTPLFGLTKKTRTAIYVSKSDKKSRKSEKPLFASFFLFLPGLFIVDFVSISYYLPDINKKYFRISNYNNSFLDKNVEKILKKWSYIIIESLTFHNNLAISGCCCWQELIVKWINFWTFTINSSNFNF